jgi:hypothetical protein
MMATARLADPPTVDLSTVSDRSTTMPESKADRTRHANEEVLNFLNYGDARGPRWLATHPDAQERAHRYKLELTGSVEQSSVDTSADLPLGQ